MAKYRERPPFPLGLDPAAYNPTGLKAYSFSELQTEYKRLYQEVRSRLRGLGRSPEWSQTQAYTENRGKFTQPRYVTNERDLRYLVQEAARFVTARGSSVQGLRAIRKEAIQTLHLHGYDWVNTKNFRDWADFMEQLRADQEDNLYYGDPSSAKDKKADVEALHQAFIDYMGGGAENAG